MENFEEPATAFNGAAHQVPTGVDLLEKGAFERGLPEIEETCSGSNNHRMHDNFQPYSNSAPADDQSQTPPVILLIDD